MNKMGCQTWLLIMFISILLAFSGCLEVEAADGEAATGTKPKIETEYTWQRFGPHTPFSNTLRAGLGE